MAHAVKKIVIVQKQGASLGACGVCFKPVLYGTPIVIVTCSCCGSEEVLHQLCAESENLRLEQEEMEDGLLSDAIN